MKSYKLGVGGQSVMAKNACGAREFVDTAFDAIGLFRAIWFISGSGSSRAPHEAATGHFLSSMKLLESHPSRLRCAVTSRAVGIIGDCCGQLELKRRL